MRTILTTPQGERLLDIAADGRVLISIELHKTEVVGIDPATGKERRGLEWFDGSSVGDILPEGKAIALWSGEGRQGRCTSCFTGNSMARLRWRWDWAPIRDFHPTERAAPQRCGSTSQKLWVLSIREIPAGMAGSPNTCCAMARSMTLDFLGRPVSPQALLEQIHRLRPSSLHRFRPATSR